MTSKDADNIVAAMSFDQLLRLHDEAATMALSKERDDVTRIEACREMMRAQDEIVRRCKASRELKP